MSRDLELSSSDLNTIVNAVLLGIEEDREKEEQRPQQALGRPQVPRNSDWDRSITGEDFAAFIDLDPPEAQYSPPPNIPIPVSGCEWTARVQDISITYRYELLTAGFVPRDGDNAIVSSLNEKIPLAAQEILGLEPCDRLDRRNLSSSGGVRQRQEDRDRALINWSNDMRYDAYGILQMKSDAKAELDNEAGGCSAMKPRAGYVEDSETIDLRQMSCTPLKGQAKVTFDPDKMYTEQAYMVATDAIAEAMSNSDMGLLSSNVVGMEFVIDDGLNEFNSLTQSEQGTRVSNDLSGGEVAGIVISVLAVLALIAVVIVGYLDRDEFDEHEYEERVSHDGLAPPAVPAETKRNDRANNSARSQSVSPVKVGCPNTYSIFPGKGGSSGYPGFDCC